jgi:hypothetical protein
VIALASATLAATRLAAQEQAPRPQAPTTYEGYILNTWKGLHNKILTMAKDFPEDKYSWRPHPDSRTVLDEFRHVVIGLEMSAAELRGEKFDYGGRLKADEAKPKTRESIVKEMEAAIDASYKLVENSPKPRLVWWLEHQAEHYGKLVSNYRINGLVPPISRPPS